MVGETLIAVCAHGLSAWQEACAEIGVDHGAALPLAAASRDGMVPLGRFVETLERIAGDSRHGILGWMVGERYDLRTLGPVGRAILSSSTLGAALRRFVDYFGLVQDATEFELREAADTVVLSYRILDPEIWPREQDALFTLSIIAQLLRRAPDFEWKRLRVSLESNDMGVATALRRRIGVSCLHDGETNALSFPAAFLALPMLAHGSVVPPDYTSMRRDVARRRRSMSVAVRVRTAVYRHLGVPDVDQERIAADLGMSTRSLRRKLAEEGTSFQQIAYACRMRHAAQQFRQRRGASIAEIALRLGYSEHSAFTRAFTRWTGMAPQDFRRGQTGP